jgi:hypothetical protein
VCVGGAADCALFMSLRASERWCARCARTSNSEECAGWGLASSLQAAQSAGCEFCTSPMISKKTTPFLARLLLRLTLHCNVPQGSAQQCASSPCSTSLCSKAILCVPKPAAQRSSDSPFIAHRCWTRSPPTHHTHPRTQLTHPSTHHTTHQPNQPMARLSRRLVRSLSAWLFWGCREQCLHWGGSLGSSSLPLSQDSTCSPVSP